MDNKDIVRQFINSEFMADKPEDRLADDESLIETGTIDSLGILKLTAFLEEKFQIKVMDEELIPENFETIIKLHDFINMKINPQS